MSDRQPLCRACMTIMSKLPDLFQDIRRQKKKNIAKGEKLGIDGRNTTIEFRKICDLAPCQIQRLGNTCPLCKTIWAIRESVRRALPTEYVAIVEETDILWAYPYLEKKRGPHIPQNRYADEDFCLIVAAPSSLDPMAVVSEMYERLDMRTVGLIDKSDYGRLLYRPKPISQSFDISTALQWMQSCKAHHASCNEVDDVKHDITLIDCFDRTLHHLDMSQTYVALSYVWGSVKPTPLDEGRVPFNTSAVILDAIELTISLGLRYLWADQYCINQTDETVKMRQIAMMDLIYSQAELTVVAAAGHDAAHGLPGCFGRSRQSCHKSMIASNAGYDIVDLGPDALHDLASSKWSTRGWTYQEAWLSRKLLIFTETQCYWECEGIACAEGLEQADVLWHRMLLQMYFSDLRFGPFRRAQQIRGTSTTAFSHNDAVNEMLSEYSRRELSFDSDALNAVAGILASSARLHRQAHYDGSDDLQFSVVAGIPLLIGDLHGISMLEQTLVSGLAWYHCNLDSRAAAKLFPERRTAFPSWTWAGWKGPISHCWAGMRFVMFDACVEDVFVSTQSGTATPLSLYEPEATGGVVTLSFNAFQVPAHWLSLDANGTWSLCDSAVEYFPSEPASRLLGSLSNGNHRLVLIAYSEEEREGLIWVVCAEGAVFLRVGVIRIHPGDALGALLDTDVATDARRAAKEKLSKSVTLMIESGSPQIWNVV